MDFILDCLIENVRTFATGHNWPHSPAMAAGCSIVAHVSFAPPATIDFSEKRLLVIYVHLLLTMRPKYGLVHNGANYKIPSNVYRGLQQ